MSGDRLDENGNETRCKIMAHSGNNRHGCPRNLGRGVTAGFDGNERIVGTMPVETNTQPYGLLHGGASCVLAETLGSVGAAMHAASLDGSIAVGVDINASHHKGVTSGTVTGVATPLRLGRAMAWYEIVITDEQGERVCTARLTCAIRPVRAT